MRQPFDKNMIQYSLGEYKHGMLSGIMPIWYTEHGIPYLKKQVTIWTETVRLTPEDDRWSLLDCERDLCVIYHDDEYVYDLSTRMPIASVKDIKHMLKGGRWL